LLKPLSDFNVDAEFRADLRFVFGLLKVARASASEIEPYTLFTGALKYLFWTGISFSS
jgi:hypothetical protein